MGWNEGIVVLKQITDEKKWFIAMEDIKAAFQGAPRFKEHLDSDSAKYGTSGTLWDFWKQTKIFDEINVRAWEILEPINFCENGFGFQWCWQDFHGYVKSLDKKAIKDKLNSEKEELYNKLADEKTTGGMTDCYQLDIERVDLALDKLDSLSPADIEVLSKATQSSPPVLYEFLIAEHPKLPVFGRHFRSCDSKILEDSDEVIAMIYSILKRHFPDHVEHWSELKADWACDVGSDYPDCPISRGCFVSAPGEAERRAKFYSKLKEQLHIFKEAGNPGQFEMARRKFANSLEFK